MNISSCTAGSNGAQNINPYKQEWQDFKGLRSALQSGDISQAQSALATLQTDAQSASTNGKTSPLLDPNTQAGKDFQSLQSAVQSGDIDGAKKAFAAVRKDLHAAFAHSRHQHHKVDNDGDGDDSTTTQPSTQVVTDSLNVTA